MTTKLRRYYKHRNRQKRKHDASVQSRVRLMQWAVAQMRQGRTIIIDAPPGPELRMLPYPSNIYREKNI